MVPWSHPSTLVIAINQPNPSENPRTGRFWSDSSVEKRCWRIHRQGGKSTQGTVCLLGYPQKYFHIIHGIHIYHFILNKYMQIILKYLDLGIWNWIIPKNKTINSLRISYVFEDGCTSESGRKGPHHTSNDACLVWRCLLFCHCLLHEQILICWIPRRDFKLDFLLVAFSGLLYSSAFKWSMHLDSNMSAEKSYIYLLCPFWQHPVSTMIQRLVGAFGFGWLDVLGDPTFPQNKPS